MIPVFRKNPTFKSVSVCEISEPTYDITPGRSEREKLKNRKCLVSMKNYMNAINPHNVLRRLWQRSEWFFCVIISGVNPLSIVSCLD